MPTKIVFHIRSKTKRKRKWTFIFGRKKRKRKSPDNISVFLFFINSVTKSALRCAVNTSSSFAFFCVWSLTGFHVPHVQCIVRYLCVIFVDYISTREQFAFLVYCYRVKAIFHNLCTVLYWRPCDLTNSPRC